MRKAILLAVLGGVFVLGVVFSVYAEKGTGDEKGKKLGVKTYRLSKEEKKQIMKDYTVILIPAVYQ